MKQAQLIEAIVKNGKLLFVGRVVFFKKEIIPYLDKNTRAAATFNKVEYSVVGANGVVFVQPDTRKIPGFNMAKYESPFKNGDLVVVEVQSMFTEKGQTTITGNIEPLEA